MSRLFKNFTKRFMHGESSSGGGGGNGGRSGRGGNGDGDDIPPIELAMPVEDIMNILNQAEEEDAGDDGGQRGGRGRRGGQNVVRGRVRRGARVRSDRVANLEPFIDASLNAQKHLSDFRQLPVGEVHVSTQTALASRNIRGRGSFPKTLKIYQRRLRHIPAVHRFLHSIGFHYLLGIHDLVSGDIQLCSALALRWYKTTHTFHFQCGELGITPLDFSMLTGISIGGDLPALPYDQRWMDHETLFEMLPSLYSQDDRVFQSSTSIRVSAITRAIKSLLDDYDNDLEIARLYLMYLMGNVFWILGMLR